MILYQAEVSNPGHGTGRCKILFAVSAAGYGGIWRDMAGYREIPGDTRRYEIRADTGRYGQIRGDARRCKEIRGDTVRYGRDTSRYRKKTVRTRACTSCSTVWWSRHPSSTGGGSARVARRRRGPTSLRRCGGRGACTLRASSRGTASDAWCSWGPRGDSRAGLSRRPMEIGQRCRRASLRRTRCA